MALAIRVVTGASGTAASGYEVDALPSGCYQAHVWPEAPVERPLPVRAGRG
jgi:hypothetical protein